MAALSLFRHMDSVAPDKRTPFERHMADSEEVMDSLQSFAHRADAVCLWQGGAEYRKLFQFLALRFLVNRFFYRYHWSRVMHSRLSSMQL